MAMVVKNNMTAVNTLNILNKNQSALAKSLQKVSSGMKINSAADDASGYAISERMRVQIRSLDQANQNTQNGSAMMKVAEGAVSSTVDILKTLKEKAINAANDSNTDSDRQTIQKELDQSIDQIDDNANVTYNGKYLVDGSKNNVGKATYNSLTNQSLSADTTGATKITDLAARNGDSLQIVATDRVTVSYVQAGNTYTASFTVGDKTLQDIFKAAEDIDTTGNIFATDANEDIQQAKGVTDTSATNLDKTIEYVKSLLSNGGATVDTVGTAFSANTLGKSSYAAGLNITVASTAGALFQTVDGATTGAELKAYTYADSEGEIMPVGSLYSALIEADSAVKDAEDNMGYYNHTGSGTTAASGSAGKLGNLLNDFSVAWNGKASELDTVEFQRKLQQNIYDVYGAGSSEAKKVDQYIAEYKADKAAYDNATAEYDAASKEYVDATKALTALEAQKKIDDQKTLVGQAREAFLATAATQINNAGSVEWAGVKSISTTGVVTLTGTTSGSVNATASDRQKMLASLASDLAKLEGAVNDSTTAATGGLDTITNNYKTNETAGDTANTNLTSLAAAYKTALGKLATLQNGSSPDANILKDAQEKYGSLFNGPALLTGANVGVNGAGKTITTASGENAITVMAATAGIGGQISGLNISISDAQGNAKKSANAALDAFEETVRAQNKSADNALSLQVGSKANQSIRIGLTDMRSEALGLKGADGTKLNISTQTKANAAINVLDNAIQKALDQQTTIGAVESRLEYTSSNLTTASENVQSSESTIRDADMAKEMTEYTKNNVLMQAAQSMLAQANQSSSNVLSLLQ